MPGSQSATSQSGSPSNSNPYDPSNILRTLYGAGTPSAGSLTSGPVSGYNPAFGGVPSVPNPISTQQQAVQGDLSNLFGLQQLGGGLNQFNAQQAAGQYQANLPLYNQLNQQGSQNILSNLQGKLPQDVVDLIGRQAAERGVAIGSPGSPNANASLLRSLGLTSLDLMNQGQNQFTQAIGRTPTGPLFNPASMFVTPEQQQMAQLLQNIFGSAPIPGAAAAANMNALSAGVNRGQGATSRGYSPTQSQDLVGSIIQKYAPGGVGTPSPGATPLPQGNWMQQEDGTWVNLDTGEVSWTGPGEESLGPNYYPDFSSGQSQEPQAPDQSTEDFMSQNFPSPFEYYPGDEEFWG